MSRSRQRTDFMRHLDPERLAALGDGEPTADEAVHLADCAFCERERLAYRELLSLSAAERAVPLAEPLTDWDALSAGLSEEGILRPAAGSSVVMRVVSGGSPELASEAGVRYRAPSPRRVWLSAAAAVLLAGGGVAAGRASAGAPLSPFVPAEAQLPDRKSVV